MSLLRRESATNLYRSGPVAPHETYPAPAELNHGEKYYPLHVYVCGHCYLVQLDQYESAENIFSDYAYFSSFSDSWLKLIPKTTATR